MASPSVGVLPAHAAFRRKTRSCPRSSFFGAARLMNLALARFQLGLDPSPPCALAVVLLVVLPIKSFLRRQLTVLHAQLVTFVLVASMHDLARPARTLCRLPCARLHCLAHSAALRVRLLLVALPAVLALLLVLPIRVALEIARAGFIALQELPKQRHINAVAALSTVRLGLRTQSPFPPVSLVSEAISAINMTFNLAWPGLSATKVFHIHARLERFRQPG
jgi:hypothetical protein